MTFTKFVNGTIGNADEINKLIKYYSSKSDAAEYSDASGNVVDAVTLSGFTCQSSDASVVGIYIDFEVKRDSGASSSYYFRIVGSAAGTFYTSPANNASDGGKSTISSSQQVAVYNTGTTYERVRLYIELPPDVIKGDTSYNVIISHRSNVAGATSYFRNTTVKLFFEEGFVSND